MTAARPCPLDGGPADTAPWWSDRARCPECEGAPLTTTGDRIDCPGCGASFPIRDGAAWFVPPRGAAAELHGQEHSAAPRRQSWSWLREHSYRWFEHRLANLPADAAVLDIGCGPGHFRDLLSGQKVIGLDIQTYPAANMIADLARPLPLVDGSVDAVLASHLLEHIYQPRNLMDEVFRVLKPGGCLFMVTPFLIKLHQEPHDYLRYTEHWYRRALAEAGFSPVEIDSIGGLLEIFDLVNWARAQYLRRRATGWRYVLVRRLIQGQNALQRLLDGVTAGLRSMPEGEARSYPHGYGIYAEKPAVGSVRE